DILAGRIIRDVMIPYFKQGQLPAGILAGLQSVATRLGGPLPGISRAQTTRAPPQQEPLGWKLVFILFILFFFILPKFFGGSGGWLGWVIADSIFRGSQRSGRDDDWGGGFGGGGGGGFSGGGASGQW